MSELNTIETVRTLLSRGLKIKNWSLIESAYYFLEGSIASEKDEEVPDLPKKVKEDSVGRKVKNVKPLAESKKGTDNFFVENKRTKSKKRVVGKNKFEDMMGDIEIEEDEKVYSAVNDNVKPTPRKRPKYKPAQITCNGCQETFSINPALVRDKSAYMCDKCIVSKAKGRR